MALGMSTTLRNNMLDEITALIDAGTGAGKLRIYDDTSPGRPATGAAVTTQVLLAELTFSDPSAGVAASGVLTLNTITEDSSADATGTATWARILDSDNTFIMDLSVGGTSSGEDIELITTSIVAGNSVQISSATITAGNA